MITEDNLEKEVLRAIGELPYKVEVEPDPLAEYTFNIFRFGRWRLSVAIQNGGCVVISHDFRVMSERPSRENLVEIIQMGTTYGVDESGFLDLEYHVYKNMSDEEKNFLKTSFKWNPEERRWEVKKGGEYIVYLSDRYQYRLKRNKEKVMQKVRQEVHPAILNEVLKLIGDSQ